MQRANVCVFLNVIDTITFPSACCYQTFWFFGVHVRLWKCHECDFLHAFSMTVIGAYPRHAGGAVPLRFLVKTAIIVVTPPVVFHSFPLPVTHVFFFAMLLWNKGGITAEPRQSLAAGLRCWRQHCGASEVPLQGWRCYCGGAAVAGRLHDILAAAICGVWFSVVLPFRFRCC